MEERGLSRRNFVRAAGVAATATAAGAAGTAGAQEQPQFPDYVSGAKGGEFKDARGKDEVKVTVGGGGSGLAFLPTKLWIDPGTTVVFEWASAGHNVVPKEIPSKSKWKGKSEIAGPGTTHEFTFETKGMYTYFCEPHEGSGMKGAIAVGKVGGGGGEGGSKPAFPSYVDGAKVGSYKDLRGKKEVTVKVGAGGSGLAFAPTKIWIDPGTTILFEWSTGGHNVVPKSTPGGSGWEGHSGIESSGFTYEHTFEAGGMYTYFCQPHEGQGMKGAIAVGEDVPMASTGGGPEPVLPREAKTLVVATMATMGVTLSLAYFYLKYGGNVTGQPSTEP